MADVTDATFEVDVIERSKTVPVVVDLWAAWCQPCKTLTPIIEKVIGETKGLVELAKVNVEENPAVYSAFQVQGIPAVFAFIDGQIVDGFMGALPEHEIVAFVQRVLDMKAGKIPIGGGAAEGEEVEAAEGDGGDNVTGNNVAGHNDAAEETASGDAEATMSEPGADVTPTPAPAPAISAAEGDAIEAELKELLTQVKGDDEAREKFLALLEQLGPDDSRTNSYRRKLATALF